MPGDSLEFWSDDSFVLVLDLFDAGASTFLGYSLIAGAQCFLHASRHPAAATGAPVWATAAGNYKIGGAQKAGGKKSLRN